MKLPSGNQILTNLSMVTKPLISIHLALKVDKVDKSR